MKVKAPIKRTQPGTKKDRPNFGNKIKPHPIDDVRHNGLAWWDMPGHGADIKKCNFFLFRRGQYDLNELESQF